MGRVNNDGTYDVPPQAKGKGGFMLDGSIGKTIRVGRGRQLSINFMVTNILNNQKICTGGYEQSRSDYTVKEENGQTRGLYLRLEESDSNTHR